jgi:hypothetical protein
MLDERPDRIRIDSRIRRELKPFRIVTLEKSEIPCIGGAEADFRDRSQMRCSPLYVEHVLLEGARPQSPILVGP